MRQLIAIFHAVSSGVLVGEFAKGVAIQAVCAVSRWQQKLIINLSWHVKGQTVKIAISALRERRKRLQGKYGVHTDML